MLCLLVDGGDCRYLILGEIKGFGTMYASLNLSHLKAFGMLRNLQFAIKVQFVISLACRPVVPKVEICMQ